MPGRLSILLAWLLSLGAGAAAADPWAFALRDTTGLPTSGRTFGGTWADLDLDGRWDLVLGRHADDQIEFYLGRGDLRFDGPMAAEVPSGLRDPHGIAACDEDGDGRWDLYLSAGADRGHGRSCKQLWRATGSCRFVNDSPCEHLLADSLGRGRGALWLRLDGSPLPQLLVLNYATPTRLFGRDASGWRDLAGWFEPAPPSHAYVAEADDLDQDGRLDLLTCGPQRQCWRNTGGRLRLVPDAFPCPVPAVADAATGDVNEDGRPDLLLGLRGGALWLLTNVSGGDTLRFAGPRIHPDLPLVREPVSVDLADLDNDGHLDLVVAQRDARRGRPPLLARGRGDGSFEPAGQLPAAPSRAMAIWAIDLDRDGDLDLVAINGEETAGEPRGAVLVYENLAARSGLTIELVGLPGEAPHGLGARVAVTVGDRTVDRLVRSTANPWNSTVLPVHVGVGQAAGPFRVAVTWPDGHRQDLVLPRAGAAYRISAGQAAPAVIAPGS
ncbi:MAG: CRTAC1 family protein [Candidatus Krumholzibacteriia bacterium]